MSLFGKIFKRHEDDFPKDFSSPPDFSQPVGQQPGGDPFAGQQGSQFGQDPFAGPQGGAQGDEQYGQQPSTFDHDIFNVSDQPGNADLARGYARQLGGQQGQPQGVYANPTAGHETQLVLERLDTIKAELDAIKQRMIRIERFMDQAEQKNQRRYV